MFIKSKHAFGHQILVRFKLLTFVKFKEGFSPHIPNCLYLAFFFYSTLITDFRVIPGSGEGGVLPDTEIP